MQKVVIKVGTQVITREDHLPNRVVIKSLVQQIVALKKQRVKVILVSSGSVAAGRACLKRKVKGEESIFLRQMLASVGQVKLMEMYSQFFRRDGYHCAQLLATKEDFRDRHHYLCMRDCFMQLLHDDIIPIVNENDVVAINELMFTDNDELAGLIATMLDVDILILLTSVDGLFDRNPQDKEAQLIKNASTQMDLLDRYAPARSAKTHFGRGGMHTKCRIAKHLSEVGIDTYIVNGKTPNIILDAVKGREVGTLFPGKKKVSKIKKWIAYAKQERKGCVVVNACIEGLLKSQDRARSLLPIGITKILGEFKKGDIIEIQNHRKKTLGYGIAQYSSKSAQEKLGKKNQKPLVHYDYLFLCL